LKYLLSQSDIFSHFGAVKTDTTGSGASKPLGSGSRSASSAALSKNASSGNLAKSGSSSNIAGKGRRKAAASDELDEDEKAMLRGEDGEEEGEGEEEVPGKGTVLRVQPSIITGGKMR
jgi:hypothetical protein